MTEIVMLVDDQKSEKASLAKDKQKADVENQAVSGLRGRSPANSDTAITIARTRVATSTQENRYPRTQWGMGHPTKEAEGTNPKT